MGAIRKVPYVRPLAGLLGADAGNLAWARGQLIQAWGPLWEATEPVLFTQTEYYTKEMGSGLWRQYLLFDTLRPADELPDWKRMANALEQQHGRNPQGGRSVNIDPGYLAPGKLVLASTKDHEQRIYLRDGIYAEVTLPIRSNKFCAWDWTYPDYAQASAFFDRAYQAYLQTLHSR
jgi:hypothetical protein